MRFLPTRVHGVMDYLGGILLIAAPWLFNFNHDGPETWIPVAIGVAMIGMSLFTDYELGAIKMIPMPVHLMVDLGAGILLAVSPWLFQFHEIVWMPHLILGILEIGAALTTETQPRLITHHM